MPYRQRYVLADPNAGPALMASLLAGCPRAAGPIGWQLQARTTGRQETLASRPMIVTPGLLRGGGCAVVEYSAPRRHRA